MEIKHFNKVTFKNQLIISQKPLRSIHLIMFFIRIDQEPMLLWNNMIKLYKMQWNVLKLNLIGLKDIKEKDLQSFTFKTMMQVLNLIKMDLKLNLKISNYKKVWNAQRKKKTNLMDHLLKNKCLKNSCKILKLQLIWKIRHLFKNCS